MFVPLAAQSLLFEHDTASKSEPEGIVNVFQFDPPLLVESAIPELTPESTAAPTAIQFENVAVRAQETAESVVTSG